MAVDRSHRWCAERQHSVAGLLDADDVGPYLLGVRRHEVDVEALLDVDVVSNLLNVLQQVQEMGTEKRGSLNYRLSGKMNLASRVGSLPFDYQGELNYLPADAAAP